ncbi:hypothetical protein J6590_073257 [Homalodisca vitripennis]|nr:hypothetical protein J6590_073257 [Homalodisca vitripennis]
MQFQHGSSLHCLITKNLASCKYSKQRTKEELTSSRKCQNYTHDVHYVKPALSIQPILIRAGELTGATGPLDEAPFERVQSNINLPFFNLQKDIMKVVSR